MNRIPPPSDGKWGFPVPAWRGYAPTRSQEYRPDQGATSHNGVDIMYVRDGGVDVMWSPGTPNGTDRFFMPEGVLACAARDGVLWSAGTGGTGKYVVLDHGKGTGFATFYAHLGSLLVPETQRGAAGLFVAKGTPLGVISFSPRDAQQLKHLHFEVWYQGGAEANVDPWPLIRTAPLPTVPDPQVSV